MNANINKAVADFLKTAPKKFEKKVAAPKATAPKIEIDRYGQRVNVKMAAVNAAIAAFVDAGRVDAVIPDNAENFAKIAGISDVSKVRGHIAWFNRRYTFNPVKGDFERKVEHVPVAPVACAIQAAPVSTTANLHLAK